MEKKHFQVKGIKPRLFARKSASEARIRTGPYRERDILKKAVSIFSRESK